MEPWRLHSPWLRLTRDDFGHGGACYIKGVSQAALVSFSSEDRAVCNHLRMWVHKIDTHGVLGKWTINKVNNMGPRQVP